MTVKEWLGEDNKLGYDIWNNKYKFENESFDEWLDRVSGNNNDVRELISDKKFIFAGRILSNRGLDKLGKKITLSNCYVVEPPEDSLESIFDTAKKLARTYSYGGGCGVDISKLRPKGAIVNNTAKETSGAVSFMELYDLTTSLIGQNGRRGALMLSLDINHPDIIDFINIKTDVNKINKANISLRIDDNFMRSVENKSKHICEFRVKDSDEIIKKEFEAKELWDKIMYVNWDYADVGMLFWDEIKRYNLLEKDDEFEFAGTNPCAEEPLPAGGSCLLGSIILTSFIKKDKTFDYVSFADAVRKSVVALDLVLDEGLPLHPLKEQRDSVRDWRQIGLGILGLGDALIKMGIKYDTEEAINFVHNMGQTMAHEALYQSALLAKENGSYPKYKEVVMESEFFKNHASFELIEIVKKYGLRHSQLLTSAPTGTIGTMMSISTGIEPNFAFSHTRKTESLHKSGDVYYKVDAKIVKDYRIDNNLSEDEKLPDFFVSAQDIDPVMRVKMQGALQRHIDASISSTVNLPNKATIEDVSDIYMTAWKERLKGITIFRDGCKRDGILTLDTPKDIEVALERGEIAKVPDDLISKRVVINHGCGSYTLHIYKCAKTGEIFDCFINSKSQGCQSNVQTIAVTLSLLLRAGVSLDRIEKALNGTGACPSFMVGKVQGKCSNGKSCGTAILQAIKDYRNVDSNVTSKISKEDMQQMIKELEYLNNTTDNDKCPECGEKLQHTGGCIQCTCGYSKCS
ncbi:MAG: adenosylcobalamin-dependent ribonucleoside-diphosphate reductase [Cetobacterium sp.]